MTKHKRAGDWCILRTSGGKTLALANSLGEAGFEVWTPRYIQVRAKRDHSKLLADKRVEQEIAITPTFVFARADRIADLVSILAVPVNPHPAFSLFRHAGRIPLIADVEIAGLRLAEERSRIKSRRAKRRALVMGQRVKFSTGAFAGMGGEVIKVNRNGKAAMVAFGGGLEVEIEAWQLPEDVVCNDSSDLGEAA